MKPEETLTSAGELRFLVLRKMFRTVTENALNLEKVSNWALAVVGIGGGFVIANIDKVEQHLETCPRHALFTLTLLSGISGVLIKLPSAFIRFDLKVEGTLFRYFWEARKKQMELNRTQPENAIKDFDREVMFLAVEEFLESRPLLFQLIAKNAMKRSQADILFIAKTGAYLIQWIMVLLVLQIVFLALAGTLLGYGFFW
jgi:hypothetical protein